MSDKSGAIKLLPAIVWAVFILIICGFPGDKFPELTFLEWLRPDKVIHLILFGVQSFLLLGAFENLPSASFFKKHAVRAALAISIAYGGLVELLQDVIFINRNGDVRDFAANTIGAFAGWWAFHRYVNYKSASNK